MLSKAGIGIGIVSDDGVSTQAPRGESLGHPGLREPHWRMYSQLNAPTVASLVLPPHPRTRLRRPRVSRYVLEAQPGLRTPLSPPLSVRSSSLPFLPLTFPLSRLPRLFGPFLPLSPSLSFPHSILAPSLPLFLAPHPIRRRGCLPCRSHRKAVGCRILSFKQDGC